MIKIISILLLTTSCFAETELQVLQMLRDSVCGQVGSGAVYDSYWSGLLVTGFQSRIVEMVSWIVGLQIAQCVVKAFKW